MAKNVSTRSYSVDKLMTKVSLCLIRDFQHNLNDPSFCSSYSDDLLSGNVARIREGCPAPTDQMGVAEYKATYQMASVLKRYRYQSDIYSDEDLIEKAIQSFLETQRRIRDLDFTNLDANTKKVLSLARVYIAKVLGKYSDEEHRDLCRFGSGASIGVPARAACEAARWELPVSGSHEQIAWFDSEMSQICQVQEYWAVQKGSDPNRSTYQVTSSLKLTLVPKTFKSFRAIMPNTTIGSYMSYGLGEMIRKRLKKKGFDIRSLQMRHRYLARQASCHGLLVTADLSSASDSISVALVDQLFPDDWLKILHQSRIGLVDLPNGCRVESQTFCTMGVGYTFPLQTLVFLSLLKAIEATLFNRLDRRTISVYGDDLIYSSRMHTAVVSHFERLGFVINLDKTFHDGRFRESCGGDYYHGVDVRPFQPRNGSATVGKHTYEAVLYKYVNTLLARWSEHEIERTLRFLCHEIVLLVSAVKVVPMDYPDDSGVKCPTLTFWDFLKRSVTVQPKHLGSGVYRFPYLRLVPDLQEEKRHAPYFWLAVRGVTRRPNYTGHRNDSQGDHTSLQRLIEAAVEWREKSSSLLAKEVRPIQTFRSSISGCRLRRVATYVTISHSGRYKRQSGVSGFENRRQLPL